MVFSTEMVDEKNKTYKNTWQELLAFYGEVVFNLLEELIIITLDVIVY